MSIKALPLEVLVSITAQLPYASHLALSLTCKRLHSLTYPSPPPTFRTPRASTPINSKAFTLDDLLEMELWPCHDACAYVPHDGNSASTPHEPPHESPIHHSPVSPSDRHPPTERLAHYTSSNISARAALFFPDDVQAFLSIYDPAIYDPTPPVANRDFFTCSVCKRIRSALYFLNDHMVGGWGKELARIDKYDAMYGTDCFSTRGKSETKDLRRMFSGFPRSRMCIECMEKKGRLYGSGRMVRYGGALEGLSEERGEGTGYALGCSGCTRFVRLGKEEGRRLRELEKEEMERARKSTMSWLRLVRRVCRGCKEAQERERRAREEGRDQDEVERVEVEWP